MTTVYNLDNDGLNVTDLATGDESSLLIPGQDTSTPTERLLPGWSTTRTFMITGFLCAIGYDERRIAVFVRDPTLVDCDTCGFTGIWVGYVT